MRWLLLLALAVLALPGAARSSEPAFPEKPYWVCARFPSTAPSAVTADVKVIGGSQLSNNVAVTQQQIDGVNSDYWCVDLNTVVSFASDCSYTTYLVRFHPDAANCAVSGGTPSLCVDHVVNSGGLQCRNSGEEQTVTYPTVAIPSRGITATVIARGNPSYIKHEVKLDNVAVAHTWYSVFYYDAAGRVQNRLRSDVPPSP